MAGSIGREPGGILAVCRLIEAHGEAVETDLLLMGRSLDELGLSLSWRDLFVLSKHWQVTPGSKLSSSIEGAEVWPREQMILADIFDSLAAANWQRQGRANAKKPEAYKRPWVKSKEKKLGSEAIPISQFNDWWDSQKKAA